MRNICLVTNHNYAFYLKECLNSLASQTRKFDRIIIVDDGSTDDSREDITSFCREVNYAVAIHKNNGGQLSCFNAALEHINADDFVFFMDSDDLYPHDYLEVISPVIGNERADFIFVTPVRFRDGAEPLQSCRIGPDRIFTFSSTSALTRNLHCFIGAETSSLCMKGALYHALLPYPYEEDWKTQADDLLTFGASIVGAHKLYLGSLGISYRIHARNSFAGRQFSPYELADWRLRRERLFRWYAKKTVLPSRAPLYNVMHEVILIPASIRKRFAIPSPALIPLWELQGFASAIRLLFKKPEDIKRL